MPDGIVLNMVGNSIALDMTSAVEIVIDSQETEIVLEAMDPGDTAALLIAAHEAAGNPHPTYLTQAEGDALYEPLGGGGGGVDDATFVVLSAHPDLTDEAVLGSQVIMYGEVFDAPAPGIEGRLYYSITAGFKGLYRDSGTDWLPVAAHPDVIADHVAEADPHPDYLTAAEGNGLYDAAGTAATAIANHIAAGDPHPGYLTQAEADALYDILGAAAAVSAAKVDRAGDTMSGSLNMDGNNLEAVGYTNHEVVAEGDSRQLLIATGGSSIWNLLCDASVSFTGDAVTKYDPVMFMGWNIGAAGSQPNPALGSLYFSMEHLFWSDQLAGSFEDTSEIHLVFAGPANANQRRMLSGQYSWNTGELSTSMNGDKFAIYEGAAVTPWFQMDGSLYLRKQLVHQHATATFGLTDGTANATMTLRHKYSDGGGLQLEDEGGIKWLLYKAGGAPELYLRDTVNGVMHAMFVPGAGATGRTDLAGSLNVYGDDSRFGPATAYVILGSIGTGSAWLDARGAAADIDLNLRAKGGGGVTLQSYLNANSKTIYNVAAPAPGTTQAANAQYAEGLITTHSAAVDPHGDRAYAAALVDDLSGVSDQATARTNLGLGTVATLTSDTDGTLAANSDARVATQKAVKTYVDALPGSSPASEAAAGIVELATAAETLTGTDNTRAVTPKGLNDSDHAIRALRAVINGQGSAIGTGAMTAYVSIPWACTVESWRVLADQSCTATIDVWCDTYANFPPTNDDSIVGAGTKPATSAANKGEGSSLGGWTDTTLAKGSVLEFEVEANDNAQILIVELFVRVEG